MIETRIVPAQWCLVSGVTDEETIKLIRNCEPTDRELINEDSMDRTFVC